MRILKLLLGALMGIFKSLTGIGQQAGADVPPPVRPVDDDRPEDVPAPIRPVEDDDPDSEADSLNDLLRIRAANRGTIEAVNDSLGTALGFKWSNGQKTDHPCIIIFVPQKTDLGLVPEAERAPQRLEAPDGTWCFTDVVTGGKAESLEEFDSLPPLSPQNKRVIYDLRSGRIGLVGGIQLAFYGDGIED